MVIASSSLDAEPADTRAVDLSNLVSRKGMRGTPGAGRVSDPGALGNART